MGRVSRRQVGGEGGSQLRGRPSRGQPATKKSRTLSPIRIIELSTDRGSDSHSESDRHSFSPSESEEQQSSLGPSSSGREPSYGGSESPSPGHVVEDQTVEDDVQSVEARIHGASTSTSSPIGSGVTLSDSDVLDCPICTVPLSPPVYQCENGHLACSACCIKIRNKCPSCCKPIGHNNRCRAMEKVLETAKTSCQNMQYGCKEKISYIKKLDHKKTCEYAPCSCPHLVCNYVGMSKHVYRHFNTQHQDSLRRFNFDHSISLSLQKHDRHRFLQELEDDTLFIVNHSFEPFGSLVNVVCVAPTSSKNEYSYDLTATLGNTSINMKSVAKLTPNWSAKPPAETYLIFPSYFIGPCEWLELELIIRKNRTVEDV